MKNIIVIILLCCSTAHAGWYRINAVPSYNTIVAAKVDGETDPVTIRIRNLEKIEYIQPYSERVLIGGEEAISLAKSVLQGQLVWIENLQAEEGAYVADVYPSFEQVITAYKEKRIVNGDNMSESTKGKLKIIYKQMLLDLNLAPLSSGTDNNAQDYSSEARKKLYDIYLNIISDIRLSTPKLYDSESPEESSSKQYQGDFPRALFIADAVIWFLEKGQYMHPAAQKLFVDLLQSFPNESGADARYTQIRVEEIMKKEVLFKELFLNTADFEQGKFTYTCLDWFKNRGQFLPDDVQEVFINWLRVYQQTHSTESDFMKQRLQWMIDNNGLYQDFLELGN